MCGKTRGVVIAGLRLLRLRGQPLCTLTRVAGVQAQASKTRQVVAQQKVLILLKERVKAMSEPVTSTKAKRDKVQGFLKVILFSAAVFARDCYCG